MHQILVRMIRGVQEKAIEGFFGLYYSSYRAYVNDNQDPDNMNRLELFIPHVSITVPHPTWAYPKGNFAGEGYGMQILPSKGDVVWVEFEFGNLERPIWAHGYFGLNEKPKEDLADVQNYWFKTPNGHLLELNDNKKLIRITDVHGNILEMNENGISTVPKDALSISHGKLNKSAQPHVLGDNNGKLFDDLISTTSKLCSKVSMFSSAGLTAISSDPMLAPLLAAYTQLQIDSTIIKTELEKLKQEIPGTKSKICTLE